MSAYRNNLGAFYVLAKLYQWLSTYLQPGVVICQKHGIPQSHYHVGEKLKIASLRESCPLLHFVRHEKMFQYRE